MRHCDKQGFFNCLRKVYSTADKSVKTGTIDFAVEKTKFSRLFVLSIAGLNAWWQKIGAATHPRVGQQGPQAVDCG